VLVVGMVTPLTAQAILIRDPGLYTQGDPGSVVVFPKFLTGTVDSGDGTQLPMSAFEITTLCPSDADSQTYCGLHPTIALHGEWVCPGNLQDVNQLCTGNDFHITTTVNGTLWFDANGNLLAAPAGTFGHVAAPSCPKGYLIVWVEASSTSVTPAPGTAISFNGLIGDAVLRPSNVTEVKAYNAVTIQSQAITGNATQSSAQLDFNGSATNYQRVTSDLAGTVRYDDSTQGVRTFLTFLTLDVALGQSNDATNASLLFFDQNEAPLLSTTSTFLCWEEVELTTDLGSNLSAPNAVKGLFFAHGSDIFDTSSSRTLLGLIETEEVIPSNACGFDPFREYAYLPYIDPNTGTNTSFIDPPARASSPIVSTVPGGSALVPSGTTSKAAPAPVPSGTTSALPSLPLPLPLH
jgi:hypothetical protein